MRTSKLKFLSLAWLFASSFFLASQVDAFPEMVRHGYVNCTSCHVSPNGGGILTQYGRSLSREVLSTWGTENEPKFLYGLVSLPEWLNLGGDIRALQMFMETPKERSGRFILMQADLEGAGTYKDFTAVVSLGRQEVAGPHSFADDFISRRHFILYKPSDEFTLRAGRFMPAFGINTAEHFIATKRYLGFDEGTETYNLEGAYLGDKWDAFLTAIFGRPGNAAFEKGLAARSSVFLDERFKLGLSYYYGTNDTRNRHLFGPFALLGITPHFFILAETDFQRSASASGALAQWGFVNYLRVDYEWIQGLHTYATGELTRPDFKEGTTVVNAYGLGVQFFPRPHFELNATWQKRRDLSRFADFFDYGYIMAHYYL